MQLIKFKQWVLGYSVGLTALLLVAPVTRAEEQKKEQAYRSNRAVVQCEIQRNGQLTDIKLLKPSQFPTTPTDTITSGPSPFPRGPGYDSSIRGMLLRDRSANAAQQKNVDFGPFVADLQRRVLRKWHKPITELELQQDGQVTGTLPNLPDVELLESSVMQAVQSASPVSPLPADAPNHVGMQIVFDLGFWPSERHIEHFNSLKKGMPATKVLETLGRPDKDVGSDFHIYVYGLQDGSKIYIGCAETVMYINHLQKDGVHKLVE